MENMKKPKNLIIFGIIIVVVIGASATAAIFLSIPKSSDPQSKDNKESTSKTSPTDKKINEADKLAYNGNVQEGVSALDKAIQESGDNHAKFLYSSQKALLLFNNNQLDGALVAAKQAFEFEQVTDSAAFVGQVARAKGDTKMALEYYKKARDLIKSDSPMAERDKEYYTSVIVEIEKGQ